MALIHIAAVLLAVCGLLVWSNRAQAQSREDIQKSLKRLESSAPPAERRGAMCYKMAMPAEYVEYICPVDGEKTAYSRNSPGYGQVTSLPVTRQLLKKLQPLARGITFSLDERALCAQCSPGTPDKGKTAYLVLRYKDGREVRTKDVSPNDIRYLIGFFGNGLTYESDNEGTLSLQKVEARLKELLGE